MRIKMAVIIKHRFRDYDWRVDIVEVDENTGKQIIENKIESEMLGPFEVIAITDRIDFNRHLNIDDKNIKERV